MKLMDIVTGVGVQTCIEDEQQKDSDQCTIRFFQGNQLYATLDLSVRAARMLRSALESSRGLDQKVEETIEKS
jgi:hypothetical protein